jgi:AcrR family transcriptional regulator/DNA-binding MarR family transcriptional regulator
MAAERCRGSSGSRDASSRNGSSPVRNGSSGSQNGSRSVRRGGLRPAATSHFGHAQVSAMQRSRLLVAAVGAVVEHGWEGASVARVTQRAGVSRRTFYEMFENREECLLAVLENAIAQIKSEIDTTDLDGLAWGERVRGGLWRILCFFDREPALARVCLVESRRGGGIALAYRQEIIEGLAAIIQEGSGDGPGKDPRTEDGVSLTAHGVIGGIAEVLYSRLLKAPGEPLRGLLGELMGMIVLPYNGPDAAREEQSKPLPASEPARAAGPKASAVDGAESAVVLPMRLTYRTASVLQTLAEQPGLSNRQVADRVGISDQGQASKLLSRLAHLGLLVNDEAVKGERNKWVLTPTGKQVARSIQSYTPTTQTAEQAR